MTKSGNRIDELADKLFKAGKQDSLESELLKFDPKSLKGVEKESWHHIYGVEAFRKGKRQIAFERFQEGIKDCPESGVLAFSMGQEYEGQGKAEEMISWFDRATFPRIPASYSLAQARYAYLWGRFDKGADYLRPIMKVYFDLKILDSTFLYIRGLPFFSQTWDYMAAFSKLRGDFKEIKELTERATRECSDFDFDLLKLELNCYETGDYALLRAEATKWLERAAKSKTPLGYQKVKRAVLESQACPDIDKAESLLSSVKLDEKDFRWLPDILLLTRCELAYRNNDLEKEGVLRGEFIKMQRLLFEPDHALNFNLLKYQERLRPIYQDGIGTH